MVAKNRKQTGKSPATQADRDKSPLVSPPGKSNIRRPGREGKAFTGSHPNGLSGIRHKLGLTPSAVVKLGITLFLAALTGYLHWYHLSQLFENDRHFSHLSNLEKEMAFRTEMVVLASWYRMYTGMGDPAYFYVACVFLLNGVMMSLFFLYGAYLSGSRLGGIVTTMCFFFNHGESTRVMWTPPLRESFAYPFLVLQMLLLTYILRARNPSRTAMVALGISNLCFMLPWQFAQFVLLTQVASLFASYILGYLGPSKMQSILVMQGLAWVGSTVLLKFMLSTVLGASDDAHISGLIKSKFTSYKDFHTLMYTCAAEFDFMELETPLRYLKTLLLPINMLVVALIAGRLVYHSLQLVAFAVLAILIMRLKLFLTPHMCIMASLICSKQLFSWIGERLKLQIVVFAIMAVMAVQGVANLQAQWGIIGEFSNLPQEELLDWIQENTRSDSVFAGAMPTMASIKLSTGRPIVNHPHYEDAGLRERTKLVYSMYSRMSGEAVKRNLMKLGVDFFVLEDSWCTRRTRPGCSMPEIWDTEDPENIGKIPLCTHMSRNSRPHFTTVFSNDIYKVLKVPKVTKDLR
ncbi:hypothetical protein INR49_001919 [Caranx melampygus]|nr:hypothetical protein INR49_001919 [Caranx melampygus]